MYRPRDCEYSYWLYRRYAGCAMIGQSIINVKSGGRGRLSTFCAGMFLLLMIVFIGDWVKQIPMAAFGAIMIMCQLVRLAGPAYKYYRAPA